MWWLPVWSGLAASATLQEPAWCVHVDACRWQCVQVSSECAEVCEDWRRTIDTRESCSSRVDVAPSSTPQLDATTVAHRPGLTAFYRPNMNWSNWGPRHETPNVHRRRRSSVDMSRVSNADDKSSCRRPLSACCIDSIHKSQQSCLGRMTTSVRRLKPIVARRLQDMFH